MTVASVLQVKKLVPEAQIPTRGSVDAAGFDLYAAVDTVIPKGVLMSEIVLFSKYGYCHNGD